MRYLVRKEIYDGTIYHQVIDSTQNDKILVETISRMKAIIICNEYNDRDNRHKNDS